MPISRACSKARMMLGELPEVDMPRKTSPGVPRDSIWREKIWSKPKSLPQAVRMEESVVRATARRAGRLAERRTTNSATRCWASAAEPPLPATRSLWPACIALAVSSAMVAIVSVMWRSASVACMVAMDWASCFWTRCFMEWGDSCDAWLVELLQAYEMWGGKSKELFRGELRSLLAERC